MNYQTVAPLLSGYTETIAVDYPPFPSESEELDTLLTRVDAFRLDAYRRIDESHRAEMGQFLTPPPTVRLMASMFQNRNSAIHLLDAGAGVGSLSAGFIAEMLRREALPTEIFVTAYEIEPILTEYLYATLELCRIECEQAGVNFRFEVFQEDFIEAGINILEGGLLSTRSQSFTCAILNPPYGKIHSSSRTHHLLRSVGIETGNLYTAFLSITAQMLDTGGELVAITPRSFCNGPYFKPFRKSFLELMTLRRVHLFDSRDSAFREDNVLQENIILHAVKESERETQVTISSSTDPEDMFISLRTIEYSQLVHPSDPDSFIHIVPDELGNSVSKQMRGFTTSLEDLKIMVSTGRVVDFRAGDFLQSENGVGVIPLIYPHHFAQGFVAWPSNGGKKPEALANIPAAQDLFVPAGMYVLVKRFSSKEEKRRIVAALYDPARINASRVGFENHLNYFHRNGTGLPETLARGLALFLNSTLVDSYFRQFNGHTQVNATDLRSLKYPTKAELETLGSRISDTFPTQDEIDHYIEEELLQMAEGTSAADSIKAKKRIDETILILKDLGLEREQQNERSALTLLSLLHLQPNTPWIEASNPLLGITPMMNFFEHYYGKKYAPNTRETVRRQTVHQFMAAGLIIANPDDPKRAINSAHNVYQIEPSALALLRTYGIEGWEERLKVYLTSLETLRKRYIGEREMNRIPVTIASGKIIPLSPGGQNVLVEKIIHDFCPRFTPGGTLIYIGDTDNKWSHFDRETLATLGVTIESHGKMPDVIVYYGEKGWLVLIEAVTSHGPVNIKRRNELKELFKDSKAGLVLVTAFLDRKDMKKYLGEISWETEVWVAEAPTHMIHFNGERFLGPY